MEFLNIYQITEIVRKHFVRILALVMAIGFLTFCVIDAMQTYTCVLNFKYNHEGAETGLAPDGVSKLDPYEIQNPVVIQGALDYMGAEASEKLDLNGVRQSIYVSKVVSDLDKEVSESAALLGEKYEAAATEYNMTFSYDAGYGDEFGAKMFSGIIKEYDEFLLNKYYNKRTVSDFAKIVDSSSADYIDIADVMGLEIDAAIEYLESMAEWYPDFRSKATGYSFGEIAILYSNIRNMQHAKYYGNIRAANLAKDSEMVIKSYQSKVKDLTESKNVNHTIAEDYKAMVNTFYDSYKAAGLYGQAERVQVDPGASNNRDEDVLEDYDIEEHKNTYDNIVISYVENAAKATDAVHTINNYNDIINSYANDTVDMETKERYLKLNEDIFKEISVLSTEYANIANSSIDELFDVMITTELQYLIAPEVTKDIPVKLVTVFIMILAFFGLIFAVIFFDISKNLMSKHKLMHESNIAAAENKKIIDTKGMDEMHRMVYEQYLDGFSEFYLVYQQMVSCKGDNNAPHIEAFIRWKNSKLGTVAPGKIIDCISDLGIFKELNEWIIKNVCEEIAYRKNIGEELPIVHINCPLSEILDFGLNDIIIKYVKENAIPARCICLELEGRDIARFLEDVMLLKQMGINICIDHFENSDENREIINVLEPGYVKMSLDLLNSDMYATSKEDFMGTALGMINYMSDVIEKCHPKGIKVCVCGVEDETQDRTVSMMDIDFKQGYYYGKPEKIKVLG